MTWRAGERQFLLFETSKLMDCALVVKVPATNESFEVIVSSSISVLTLKQTLEHHLPSHPPAATQKLIHAGRLLEDGNILSSAFSTSAGPYTLHLVANPATPANTQAVEPVDQQRALLQAVL